MLAMRLMNVVWVSVLGVLLLSGCASHSPSIEVSDQSELQQWQSPLNRGAIGLGNIWSYSGQQWIEIDRLQTELTETEYLLLGEKHDNPDHHRIQWFLLSGLRQQARLGGLTMEMLQAGQQQAIDEAYQLSPLSLTALKKQLDWPDTGGWEWGYYGPQMFLAIEGGVPLKAGNLDRDGIRKLYSQPPPFPELLPEDSQALVYSEVAKQIKASHCGAAQGDHLQAMVRIQQNRDFTMAQEMGELPAVSVLVAGAYHVRKDVGVPVYLRDRQPDARILSLGMIELDETVDGGVGRALVELRGVYDYLWFTPAVARPDYCANWKAHSGSGN